MPNRERTSWAQISYRDFLPGRSLLRGEDEPAAVPECQTCQTASSDESTEREVGAKIPCRRSCIVYRCIVGRGWALVAGGRKVRSAGTTSRVDGKVSGPGCRDGAHNGRNVSVKTGSRRRVTCNVR